MNTTPATYTPDQLRAASLQYIISGAEPDERGIIRAETPGGLTIENGPGWLTMSGVLIEFVGQPGEGTEISHSITYNYGDPRSPHVERSEWPASGAVRVSTVKRSKHNQVATRLMSLISDPEVAVAS